MDKKLSTKERLVWSARELFAEKGYSDTKVEDITHKAEVAKGTFYVYFKTKEDMFIEIIENIFKNAEEELSKIKFDGSLKENLYKFIDFIAKGATQDKSIFKLLANMFADLNIMKRMIEAGFNCEGSFKDYIKKILEVSKDEVDQNSLKNIDSISSPIGKFIKIYIGEVVGLSEEKIEIKDVSQEEMEMHVEFLVEFLYKGLRK